MWKEFRTQFFKPYNLFNTIIVPVLLAFIVKVLESTEYSLTYDQPVIEEKFKNNDFEQKRSVLFESDSIKFHETVYVLRFNIWNDGEERMSKSNDEGEPISFEVNGRVLGKRITRQSKGADSMFVLNLVTASRVRLAWEYFNPGDGCQVEIKFATKDGHADLRVSGTTYRVKNIDLYQPPMSTEDSWKYFILGCFLISAGVLCVRLSIKLISQLTNPNEDNFLIGSLFVIGVSAVFAGVFNATAIFDYVSLFYAGTPPNFLLSENSLHSNLANGISAFTDNLFN